MATDPTTLEVLAAEQLEKVKQRMSRVQLWSRTSLTSALVTCMATDFVLLREAALHVEITAVQSALLLWVLAVANRREAALPEMPVMRRPARTVVYLASVSALALVALVEKWWIALRADDVQRLSYASSYRVMGGTLTLAGVVLMLGGGKRLARYFAAFAEQPARQTALSFVGLAVLGAFLLSLPICIRDPSHVSFVDALFMATSAVCVTGLAVHGIASEYTLLGQAVLLGLVQIGGIGIMVLSASLVVLTGRKLRARSSAMLAEVLDADSVSSLRGNIKRIVIFTFAIEGAGALLMYMAFAAHPEAAGDFTDAHPMAGSGSLLWAAVFHAVSAFCNAGFTLTRDGLVPFAHSQTLCTIVMCLIVLGGLGFPVLSELSGWLLLRLRRKRPLRLSLHTRTVLLISCGLLAGVAAVLGALEWNGAFAHRPWPERTFSALFSSVTLRTAGFHTLDFSLFSNAGLMLCMMIMFVGAAPGGTGGGIKVTTFAVLVATLRAELRGSDEPTLFDRRLPPSTVRRAISVAFVAVIVLTFVVLLLLMLEPADPLRLTFEAVSAFSTVGLSTNLTPSLGTAGKIIIIVTMLIGRVGPLTVAVAASDRVQRAHHRRPHERVLIG